jgi:nicotinic acid mononucleotide adenylyltransferase
MSKIVFSFGRMNPPTKGHEKLIRKVMNLAGKADHMIFLSHTQNSTTDPLDWFYKLYVAKMAFPGTKFCEDRDIKTPFQALEYLARAEGYDDITLVVGEDRVSDFQERMTPYARDWGVNKFRIVSAGKRNPKSRSISGMSGAKLRKHASLNEESSFCAGLPNTINTYMKKEIFGAVKRALK